MSRREARPDPHVPQLSNAEIIRRARGSAQERQGLFDDIDKLYRHKVYSHLLFVVKNRADAEDLTQNAFLLLYRKICQFEGRSAFFTWFYRIVCNCARMHFRSNKRKIHALAQSLESDLGDERNSERKEIFYMTRDVYLELTPERISIEQAIKELPSCSRTVFSLCALHGFEHQEVARALGLNIGTSKSQYHKARIRVLETLQRKRQ